MNERYFEQPQPSEFEVNYLHNNEFSETVDREWIRFEAQRKSLAELGAKETFSKLIGFDEAFTASPGHRAVVCIDEGCTGEASHLAGSGCGIPEEQLLSELKVANITEFTTHEGCGAWALAHPELTRAEDKESAVIAWGKGIAEKLNLPYRHISAAEMKRPPELHNAFYAIYDATGNFNRDHVPEMGPGFVTSPKYFASAKADLELAAKIAFGAHGFGSKFDQENPFVLVGVYDPTNKVLSKEQIMADLQEVQNKFSADYVKIDLIDAPAPEYVQ
jgi:hypothetical protein